MRCWRDTYALRFGRRGARWFAGEESLWIRNTLGAEQILLQVHPESLRTKRNGVRLVEAFPLEVHGLPDVHGGLEREELKQAVSAGSRSDQDGCAAMMVITVVGSNRGDVSVGLVTVFEFGLCVQRPVGVTIGLFDAVGHLLRATRCRLTSRFHHHRPVHKRMDLAEVAERARCRKARRKRRRLGRRWAWADSWSE